ncbi:hypothetical protein phiPLPE_46 [Iodobacter phage PhiPLPE]|uniref:DUF3383 family protein n=1 Tax=Iodobacter phage PhiPLPE TaxID=551895 RepID=B5AX65_9CAUD|nr:tail sheath [Iodobacter phage PhiPLPE]ACG60368.1 hypothetical protein phiPLPE_46 [Iodobacter phage PhiPLPE]
MSYDVNNIIQINTAISPQGLGFANFASAVMFAPETELPVGFLKDTYRVYNSMKSLAVDFPSTTETYKAMNRWLGGIPATRSVTVWGAATADATPVVTLDKANNQLWWYWSFFTAPIYADVTKVNLIAQWHNTNERFFMDCQTGANATAIRDQALNTDIASVLTTSGVRFASTVAHATDPYAGIAVCKWAAAVNYSAAKSTITLEGKKLSGVTAEDLTDTAYAAMTKPTKKCGFYTIVDLQGSVDNGRFINSWTHSSYGEYIDDVVNLSAFVNYLKVSLYNAIENQTTKLGQDPIGQSVLIGAARAVCEQFVRNDYLGPRNYTDPDDGVYKYTAGYEILTKPEEILNLLDADRAARKAAPLRIRIFRKGAIHQVAVDVNVY